MLKNVLIASALSLSVSSFAACPEWSTSLTEDAKEYCVLKGKFLNSEIVLTSDKNWRLDDEGVFVGGDNKENSTLTIQPGTTIYGEAKSFLAILRGSKIIAIGSKEQPIVFTSVKTTQRKRGEWGGLVLNGNAPINACKAGTPVCEAISEGIKIEPVKFGGNNAEDNSGVLKYVRLEFTGYPIAQDNELNGVTFNAVGSKTEVDYLQVNMSADDGVEFFGGTVNVKHLVLTNNDDDNFDWDMGYVGKVQFVLAKQADDTGDNGIEADNLKSPMNAEPRSNPTFSNVTFLGGKKSAYGMLLRRGTAASLHNFIVTGFIKGCIDIDDAETFSNGGVISGDSVSVKGLKLDHSILSCAKNFEAEDGDLWSTEKWFRSQEGNLTVDPQLDGFYPSATSPALGAGLMLEDLFFEPTDYVGAFASTEDTWTDGWTSFAQE